MDDKPLTPTSLPTPTPPPTHPYMAVVYADPIFCIVFRRNARRPLREMKNCPWNKNTMQRRDCGDFFFPIMLSDFSQRDAPQNSSFCTMFVWYCGALNFKSSYDIREKNNYTLKSVLQQKACSRSNFCFIFKSGLGLAWQKKKKSFFCYIMPCRMNSLAVFIKRIHDEPFKFKGHLVIGLPLCMDFHDNGFDARQQLVAINFGKKEGKQRHLSGAWLTIFSSLGSGGVSIKTITASTLWMKSYNLLRSSLLMNCFVFTVPARIVNISQDKSVNEGDDVNLFCLAIGRPEPSITWKDLKCEPHHSKPRFHGHLTITSCVITAVTRTIIISICYCACRRCHHDHRNTNNRVCH